MNAVMDLEIAQVAGVKGKCIHLPKGYTLHDILRLGFHGGGQAVKKALRNLSENLLRTFKRLYETPTEKSS